MQLLQYLYDLPSQRDNVLFLHLHSLRRKAPFCGASIRVTTRDNQDDKIFGGVILGLLARI